MTEDDRRIRKRVTGQVLIVAGFVLACIAAWPAPEVPSPIESLLESRYGFGSEMAILVESLTITVCFVIGGLLWARNRKEDGLWNGF